MIRLMCISPMEIRLRFKHLPQRNRMELQPLQWVQLSELQLFMNPLNPRLPYNVLQRMSYSVYVFSDPHLAPGNLIICTGLTGGGKTILAGQLGAMAIAASAVGLTPLAIWLASGGIT